MKSLFVTLGMIAVLSAEGALAKKKPWVSQETFESAGTILGNFINGACKAIVQNPDSDTDTCLIACGDVKSYIINKYFKLSAYTDSTVTPSEFLDKSNVFMTYSNAATNQCRQPEFMQVVDKRLS